MSIDIIKLENVLTSEEFKDAKEKINSLWKKRHIVMDEDSDMFFRWQAHNVPFLINLHKKLLPLVCEKFNKKLKRSYVFLSMYKIGEGFCPVHKDRPQCRYTLDLCLDQKEPWPIYIDDQEFMLNENEAMLYSGTEHFHYRNKIQKDNYCSLAFFHFVDEEFELDLN